MPLDDRFFPEVLRAFLLDLALVEARELAALVVEARLLAVAPARFRVEVELFLLADFFVLFFAAREGVLFFEADRPLLDLLPRDALPDFFVAILSSVTSA
jgi:hypothetical protein